LREIVDTQIWKFFKYYKKGVLEEVDLKMAEFKRFCEKRVEVDFSCHSLMF